MAMRSARIRGKSGLGAVVSGGAFAVLMGGQAMASGVVAIGGQTPGPTPFIDYISATVTQGTLTNVLFSVVPKAGSYTRPITASISAASLAARGGMSGNSLIIPVFGLYAGATNTVNLVFSFSDGSISQVNVPVTTPAYPLPCGATSGPVIQQNRHATSDLSFDYFLLKDYCSKTAPAIVDTDGNIRWVGTVSNASLPSIFYNNGIYVSDGATGVDRLELYGGTTKIGDYASYGVTYTGHHNYDRGRDGIVLDVNTTTETEAVDLEIDPESGKVLNEWDLGAIISAAMKAGGDDPSHFVLPVGTDWFHNNATTYNPADNTLIVSSRENFVIDVDYDTPPDGIKKIHWILGDTTKHWYQYPSLRKYALQLGPNTLPPIGQHAVSIDSSGNLGLFDDGYGSLTQVPAGASRTYSAARTYQINTAAMTATSVLTYSPTPSIFSYVCGSAYEAGAGSYLVDFAAANGGQMLVLQGLGSLGNVVFDFRTPESSTCGAGWNAEPLPSQILQY